MIELTKSARVALEALHDKDKKKFIKIYKQEDLPISLLKLYNAKKLPLIDKTYLLRLSKQLRAIVRLSEDNNLIILEIVKHDNLKRIFSPIMNKEKLSEGV